MRLRRQERRWLGALRGPGKAAAANRLDGARVRARLDPSAAAAEQHQLFYAHTDQWRYEKIGVDEVLSPLADKNDYGGSMIDYNVRAERMGWLPSARSCRRIRCRSCAMRRPPA